MRRAPLAAAVALLATTGPLTGYAQVDPRFTKELGSNAPGSGDQVVPRDAGAFILAQTRKDFDELTLPLGKAIGASYNSEPDKKLRYEKTQVVEGRLTRTVYVIAEGVGHTDNKGTMAYNTDLSQRRAEAVAKALAAKYGIAADRMVAKGVGR